MCYYRNVLQVVKMMLDFFFLSEEYFFDKPGLDIFRKNPELMKAPITDFAILLGGASSSVKFEFSNEKKNTTLVTIGLVHHHLVLVLHQSLLKGSLIYQIVTIDLFVQDLLYNILKLNT